MPIYAYRCEACGFAKDVLQKMSEDPLTVCPECQQASFKKQVTAAGFQLKGSGWYVTDFRGGAGASNSTSSNSNPTNRAENSAENSNSGADNHANNNANGNANAGDANSTASNNANNANIANDSKAA